MSNCVIKVGKMYYVSSNKDGLDCFTQDINRALVFDSQFKLKAMQALASGFGGDVVELEHEQIQIWIDEHIGYILNCTGPQDQMYSWYIRWCNASHSFYDMSEYIGVPCNLNYKAFPSKAGGRYVFAFRLYLIEELNEEQQRIWNACPYGLQTTDDERILVASMQDAGIEIENLVVPVELGGGHVVDTPERIAAVERYKAYLESQQKATPKRRGRQSKVSKMELY